MRSRKNATADTAAQMAQVVYARAAFADLRRIYATLAADDPTLAANTAALVREALRALESSPLSGRPAESGLHERAISRGRTGYVALYRLLELEDTVLILAIRHRRNAGYPSIE